MPKRMPPEMAAFCSPKQSAATQRFFWLFTVNNMPVLLG